MAISLNSGSGMAEDNKFASAPGPAPIENRQTELRPGEPRRNHPRFTVVWTGRIVAASRVLDCVILNISASGAKLRVFESMELPQRFTLIVDRFGDFPTELVWRDRRSAGVRFVGDPAQIGQTFAQALPVSRLFGSDS